MKHVGAYHGKGTKTGLKEVGGVEGAALFRRADHQTYKRHAGER